MLPSNHSSSRDPGEDSTPDEDQGLIRCICNIDDDDGFTIQCENCLVWQHAVCVGVEQDNVPDEYLCEKCNPRKLDVKVNSETRNAKEPRKRQKSATSKPKRSDESSDRKRRTLDPKLPRSKSAKPAGAGRDSSSPAASRITDKGRDSAALVDSSYTAIDSNILGADVQVLFQSVLSQLAEQRNAVSAAAASVTSTPPASLTASSATKNGTTEAATLQTNHVDSDSGKKQDSKALFGSPPFLNGSSNSHSSAAANEGNESALSSIAPMGFDDIDNPSPVYKALVGKERCQMGLFSGRRIERHRYVCEYKGQVLLKAAYKEDPKNYYELLRTTSPYAHFHPGIDICVDARRQGSEARFIRRSCSANVVLKSMYISGSANPLVYLGLFAQRDVEPDEELTLGWEWEDGELPALARMSPSDADDYLGRPEGRRLSKVWRQAFAGVSCACPDQQCEVRRLFTLLNVEELSAKPEIGRPLKRRTSRTAKPDSIASDIVNQSPPSPSSSNIQSQSLDDHTPIRGSHSRKGSAASGVLNGRTLREASVEVESNSNVSVQSSSQLGHSLASRDANASRNSEVLHDSDDANSDNNYGAEKSNGQPDNASDSPYKGTDVTESALAGSGDLNQRKRKLSGQSLVDPIAPTDLESRNGNSSKAHRLSVSSVSSRRTPQSTALPLKKLWMNKYLEGCSEPRIISQDGENMTIAEDPPLHTTNLAATQPAQDLKRGGSISRRGSVYEEPREPSGGDRLDTADSGPEKTEPHISSTAENGRNIIKSEPTDADAPTPPPTNSPPPGLASLEQDVTTAQALVDSAASDSKPMPQAADADSNTQNKDQIAPNAPEGITETNPN
ncbi:SET domain-containing protein 3, partial [Coemansia sp. RSA 2559]